MSYITFGYALSWLFHYKIKSFPTLFAVRSSVRLVHSHHKLRRQEQSQGDVQKKKGELQMGAGEYQTKAENESFFL